MPSQAFYDLPNANEINIEAAGAAPARKIGFTFGELELLDITPPEEIIRGLGRGYNGLLNAVTNVGKSTLIRNLALCLITGTQFPPLTVSNKLRRVCLIDTEDTLSYLKKDIGKMIIGFSDQEKDLVRSNLLLICDLPFPDDEEIRLNYPEHFKPLLAAIQGFKPDMIFVDTVSSSFSIRNENDNAEVKEKIMRPLRRLARKTDAGLLAAHHIGKAKLEDGAARENAHKGRGASSISDQSKVVFNLETGTNGDVILSCPKIKGEKFDDVILLYDKEKRWFSRQGEIKNISNYEIVLKLFADGKSYRRKEIDEMLDGEMSKVTVTRNLKSAVERGELYRAKGIYSKNVHMFTPIRDEHMNINGESQQNQTITGNFQVFAPGKSEQVNINKNECFPNCQSCGLEMNLDKDGETVFCSMGCKSFKLAERQNLNK